MMTDGEPFIDYYNILQVDWECDAKELEFAYRHLAKLYHPDHPDTADVTKFNEVIEAYRVLKNHDQRAEYDLQYAANTNKRTSTRFPDEESYAGEKNALGDAEVHERTLRYLYKRRRENAQDAGVGPFTLQEMLNCSDEHFEFHVWYLKAKGLIETTEQGTLAITIEGVDHVISMSRTIMAERLRIAQSRDAQD
jgi:curved DNA-binding protein